MVTSYDSLFALRRARRDPIGFLQGLAAKGDVIEFSMRGERAFLLNHPDFIEDTLITNSRKFAKPPALARAARLLGQGLLTAEGPLHAARRRAVLPSFRQHRMERYGEVMTTRAIRHCNGWREGATVDLISEMATLALGIVGETLFSTDLAALAPEMRDILERATVGLDPLVTVVAPNRKLRPAQRRLYAIVDDLIAARAADANPPDDLLTVLLMSEGPEATPEQLREDVLTLLLAGHDTIANALSWTMSWVGDHPHVASMLRDELDRSVERRTPQVSDLPHLRYVRAVFTESLRLTPPAWIIARRSIEAHHFGTQLIPAGSLIVMSPFVSHRDPRFFRDPDMFNPERWLNVDAGDRLRLGFFPFGAGTRSCIGESFAWMEGALVLAALCQCWRFIPAGGGREVDPRITLRPRGPMLMRVERLHGGARRLDQERIHGID